MSTSEANMYRRAADVLIWIAIVLTGAVAWSYGWRVGVMYLATVCAVLAVGNARNARKLEKDP